MVGSCKENGNGGMPRRMLEGRLFTGRRKRRRHLRWLDDVLAHLKVRKIRQWMEKKKERDQWKLVEEANFHPGM